MQTVQLYLLVIASIISDALAEIEVCSYFAGTYCEDGYYCCDNDTRCCPDEFLAIGAIIGIVIGSLVFICCCIAVVCVLAKKNHRPGLVIQPAQPGVAVITSGQQQMQPMYGQPMHGQPMPGQPMHGQPMYGQPSYGQAQYGGQQAQGAVKADSSDPAHPPPPPPAY